jgi:hypothetical protein
MKTALAVLVIILGIIFVGGTLEIGGAPIFRHVDSALGTRFFMSLHNGVFSLISNTGKEVDETRGQIKDFQEKPLGFDKKGTYRKLDKASDY